MHATKLLASCLAGLSLALAQVPAAHAQEAEPIVNSDLSGELFYQLILAEMSANQGDLGNAYSLMLNAARKANDAKLFERSIALAIQGRSGDYALDAARTWLRAQPNSREANRYVLQILLGMNRVSDSLEPLKRELTEVSGDERLDAINRIPGYYARVTDKALGIAIVQQALSADLQDKRYGPAAWVTLGLMQLNAGDKEAPWASADAAQKLNPVSDELAVLALNLMELDDARAKSYLAAYWQSPQAKADLRMLYARRLTQSNQLDAALEQAILTTQQAPQQHEPWLLRGSLEWQMQNADSAQASLQQFLQLTEPGEPASRNALTPRQRSEAYLLLSQIAQSRKDYATALNYADQADAAEDAMRAGSRKALILAEQGKLPQAREALEAIPEERPEDARTKVSLLVSLLRDNGQVQQAYDVLKDAVQRYPQDAELLYDKALLADRLGKYDAMEHDLRRVIELNPQYHHAYNALGYSLAERNTRLGEARTLVQKALELAPNDPYIIDSMAWVEYRSGNLKAAQTWLEKAYSLRTDTEIAAHLGEVLWVQGQHERANQIWGEALQHNPNHSVLQETMRRLRKKP
ncbi:tetratricopeptide repeat protein [Curvibacter sp. CHRR-16]|uniref:tetratricopeptide repeat protein n=1 Tax=Curvibacter sp. CHRR-16 TaxID=2835872 RepID=UPI001BDA3B9F|nr:tetratricopeptide repeat protein [Curvibacter sp. CHRR-16]MBT0569589.1 tetratricopeptide repeat protein [Curvibacter sp. CHRR-16]